MSKTNATRHAGVGMNLPVTLFSLIFRSFDDFPCVFVTHTESISVDITNMHKSAHKSDEIEYLEVSKMLENEFFALSFEPESLCVGDRYCELPLESLLVLVVRESDLVEAGVCDGQVMRPVSHSGQLHRHVPGAAHRNPVTACREPEELFLEVLAVVL